MTRASATCRLSNLAVLAACLVWAASASASGGERPNVVYFLADELGYYELSCMGHPHLRTPNLDRLAAEGIRFTHALAGSSLCAPTRCCLLTGRHSGRTSVRTNGGGTPLRAGEETVASVLKQAGYATGGFGKWGCGGRGSTGVPEEHGFDLFFGYYDQVHAHTYYPAYLVRNSEEVPLPGNRGGRSGTTYSQYVLVDAAKTFIRENRDRPFFCYLPLTPPHGMFDIPDDDPAWADTRDRPWPEEARRYAAMVAMLDRHVGEIVGLLGELGLEERTILFASGDNGGNDYFASREHPRGFHGPNVDPRTGAAFRGHKGNLYEGGLRIPMVVRWKGRIRPGRVSDLAWYFPDVLPTLAELAGVRPPDGIDGISIVPELLGAAAAGREQALHEYLYWELDGATAVRIGSWKGVRPKPAAPWELYDLAADPGEARDVASVHPDVVKRVESAAREAHRPAVEGTFADTSLHEKDRRAKWGEGGPKEAPAVEGLPREGLVPRGSVKVLRASSESRFNGKLAANAVDGDPRTIWHTEWKDALARHPHELVLDLGVPHEIRGVRYLARQDGGWNGTIRECELLVGDSPETIDRRATKAVFERTLRPQEARCAPVRGRYALLRILSEVNGGPWASIAELGIIGTPAERDAKD